MANFSMQDEAMINAVKTVAQIKNGLILYPVTVPSKSVVTTKRMILIGMNSFSYFLANEIMFILFRAKNAPVVKKKKAVIEKPGNKVQTFEMYAKNKMRIVRILNFFTT